MSFGPSRALVFSLNQSAFGVPATITRPAPNDAAIATSVVWVTPTTEDMPGGMEFQRREPKRVCAVSLADVPTVPEKTRIEAPESEGGPIRTWQVDGRERTEVDHVRVWVIPITEGA